MAVSIVVFHKISDYDLEGKTEKKTCFLKNT